MTVADDQLGVHGENRTQNTERTLPWWGAGIANLAVVLVLSLVSWWLLVDPQWSAFDVYPQPYSAVLFYVILATVWVGFNFEWLGPQRLGQPARGLVGIVLTLAIGIAIPVILTYGWGAVDPSFAASREGGAGWTIGNLFVLFGFFFYVLSAVNLGHWPWSRSTQQPWTGLGEITLVFIPTLIAYMVLILPNLATWATPGAALMPLPTVIGWFFSLIVAAVVTGLIAENRPWSFAKRPARVAAAAVIGNVVLGTILYFVMLTVAKLLIGPANVAALGDAVTSHAAEFGVCWMFCMVAWANIFGNKPTGHAPIINIIVRVLVTFVLAVCTYLLYYFVVAQHVLHEPNAAGSLYGDALGFLNWVILWVLWYVLFLGSYGLPKARGDAEVPALEVAVESSQDMPRSNH